ncbi:MAG: hypothetical protein ABL901_04715 [Hyphomicrobiaceae bacterium]
MRWPGACSSDGRPHAAKGIKEGHYGGDLAIDDMPQMALISTVAVGVVTDSEIEDAAPAAMSAETGRLTSLTSYPWILSRVSS